MVYVSFNFYVSARNTRGFVVSVYLFTILRMRVLQNKPEVRGLVTFGDKGRGGPKWPKKFWRNKWPYPIALLASVHNFINTTSLSFSESRTRERGWSTNWRKPSHKIVLPIMLLTLGWNCLINYPQSCNFYTKPVWT